MVFNDLDSLNPNQTIWKQRADLEALNQMSRNTLVEHLEIQFSEITDNSISATMPVCHFTHQPFGLLHGGASVVLAETVGSVAANLCVDENHYCVGLDINANHLRAKSEGVVTGTARAMHLGRSTQVWQITIEDEQQRAICVSRLTIAVKQR